jgi:hypothetical protein
VPHRTTLLGMWSLLPLAALTPGVQCVFGPAPTGATTVEVKLVNRSASQAVDPGLLANGAAVDTGRLDPGASTTVQVDCTGHTAVQAAAAAISTEDPAIEFPFENRPVLLEGIQYVCGDTLIFEFIPAELHTQAGVNDAVLIP